MSDYYNNYKVLRNEVRNFDLIDSLKACWELSNFLAFHDPITTIELPREVNLNSNPMLFRQMVIHETELNYLVTELILHAGNSAYSPKSIQRKRERELLVRKMRELEGIIYNGHREKDVFLELNRICHQQFIYQVPSNLDTLFRYHFIFSQGNLPEMIESKYGLSINTLFRVGNILFTFFASNYSHKPPFIIKVENVRQEDIEILLRHFSRDIDELRVEICKLRKYDDSLLYQFSSIKKYPLININGLYYCPLPINLFYQLQQGLYYNLSGLDGFAEQFGLAFENYVAHVISKVINGEHLTLFIEEKYGREQKRTADILLVDNDSVLLIECKTKRMVKGSRECINDLGPLESDFDKLSDAVLQLQKTVIDYKNNYYPQIQYDPNKVIYLLVITLEDWYVRFNKRLDYMLAGKVKGKCSAIGIESVQDYFVQSISDFEYSVQVIDKLGIKGYFDKYRHGGNESFCDYSRRELFKEETKAIFGLPTNE